MGLCRPLIQPILFFKVFGLAIKDLYGTPSIAILSRRRSIHWGGAGRTVAAPVVEDLYSHEESTYDKNIMLLRFVVGESVTNSPFRRTGTSNKKWRNKGLRENSATIRRDPNEMHSYFDKINMTVMSKMIHVGYNNVPSCGTVCSRSLNEKLFHTGDVQRISGFQIIFRPFDCHDIEAVGMKWKVFHD